MNTSDEILLSPEKTAPPAQKNSKKKKKKRKGSGMFGRFLRRVLLVILTLAVLAVAAAALLLNTLLNGPSPAARDLLTATLLESSETAWIPELFLEPETLKQIRTQSGAPLQKTVSDPSRISPSQNAPLWPDSPEGIRLNTWSGSTYTAHILQIRDSSRLRLVSGSHISGVLADNGALAALAVGPVGTQGGYAGFTPEGILVVSSEESPDSQVPGLLSGSPCGPVLILDGTVNQAVYGGNSGFTPRWALGQRADGTVIFLYITAGTYRDLVDVLVEYGAVNACALGSGFRSALGCIAAGNQIIPTGQPVIFGTEEQDVSREESCFWLVLPGEEG